MLFVIGIAAIVGAPDLVRAHQAASRGTISPGAIAAAEIAGLPLLDFMNDDLQAAVNDPENFTS